MDVDDKQYSTDTAAEITADSESFLNEINPGNKVGGEPVFDVPAGPAGAAGLHQLGQVRGGGRVGGVSAPFPPAPSAGSLATGRTGSLRRATGRRRGRNPRPGFPSTISREINRNATVDPRGRHYYRPPRRPGTRRGPHGTLQTLQDRAESRTACPRPGAAG
ncbi:hypothetical protein GCM10023405_00620 [Streptomonospora salina]